jgi:phosphohistidine phosphatase
MKTLLLMRHAKSSWKFKELSDLERPLTKRGRRDAPLMGQFLFERKLIPQRILASSAVRARQTAEALAENADYKGDIVYMDRLYLAEAEEYISTLRELPDDIERILVIGHNPGLETVLQVLAGKVESLPTAVIAHINIPIDSWQQLNGEMRGEVVEIWKPKEVRDEVDDSKDKDKDKGKGKEKEKEKEKSKKKDK